MPVKALRFAAAFVGFFLAASGATMLVVYVAKFCISFFTNAYSISTNSALAPSAHSLVNSEGLLAEIQATDDILKAAVAFALGATILWYLRGNLGSKQRG